MGRVNGKIALVTGAAMGIGRAIAETLAREGASLLLTDVDDEHGNATTKAINDAGGQATYLHHDVTDEDAWRAAIEEVKSKRGGLNILVNNAGIAIAGPLFDMSLDDFRRQNAVNLDGVFLGIKHGIPLIAASGGGSVINLSSVAGLKAAPGLAAYAMTKGGVRLLSKSAARECTDGGLPVRVNSIHPGIIETHIWQTMGLADAGDNRVDVGAIAQDAVPGGKLGQPQDIANMALYLASDESAYITGAEMVVDHAFTA